MGASRVDRICLALVYRRLGLSSFVGSCNEFSNEFNIVKFKDKIVSLCAPLAVLVIVTAALLHFKPAVGILRLVIACVSPLWRSHLTGVCG